VRRAPSLSIPPVCSGVSPDGERGSPQPSAGVNTQPRESQKKTRDQRPDRYLLSWAIGPVLTLTALLRSLENAMPSFASFKASPTILACSDPVAFKNVSRWPCIIPSRFSCVSPWRTMYARTTTPFGPLVLPKKKKVGARVSKNAGPVVNENNGIELEHP
jgi:hypothetical protein